MKILHTADWHLGQRLVGRERTEEHQQFLRWLLKTIRDEAVNLLIVAGDIFDSTHPSQATMQLYYDFLEDFSTMRTCGAILVGGNHDSPAHLNAARRLLKRFQIHVVGCPSTDRNADVIHYTSPDDMLDSVCVCAVPYLRDRDVQQIVVGEAAGRREERLREGIYHYYRQMRERAQRYRERGLALIATGHLTMQGGAMISNDTLPAGEHELHIGTLSTLEESRFPQDFDYMALGHLHQPHVVGNGTSMRYAGSPFPMSFGEAEQEKGVVLLEFREGRLSSCQSIPIPLPRRLYRYGGTLTGLRAWLPSIVVGESELAPWLEVHLSAEAAEPNLTDRVLELAEAYRIDLLKVMIVSDPLPAEVTGWEQPVGSLHDVQTSQVFRERLKAAQIEPDAPEGIAIQETFAELLSLHEAQQLELTAVSDAEELLETPSLEES